MEKDKSFGKALNIFISDELDILQESLDRLNKVKNPGAKLKYERKIINKIASISTGIVPEHLINIAQYYDVIFNKEIRGAFNEKERGLIMSGFSFGKIDYMRRERTGVKLNDILKKEIKRKDK